jgi:Omp85 superfamily domain
MALLALIVPGVARSAGAGEMTDSTASPAPRVRTVVAGEHYHAGDLHRFLLGSDYRRLWTTPVEIPELDLRTFAGGLRPVRRVGGQQTLGLAMRGADGHDYTFRGLDKDPTEILPPELHGTFVDKLLQDQIASSFPGGAVAVPPLLAAAGVLHEAPVLVVMPNDSLLGEFQAAFAGVLGTFEEYPRPGFGGATEIVDGAEMWKRMDESAATRPDSRAFLTARLVDILIGDWDRHRGQWRWANVPGRDKWQPIPEDRDQAFVRFEGLIVVAGRQRAPQFVSFGEDYPGIEGLTWNGRDGDRRILVDLEKPVWDEAATDLQARITDAVIAEAVARVPAAYRALEGAKMEAALRHRRDQLVIEADRFYRFLAHRVDIRATDQSEVVTVHHAENGDVAVSVAANSTAYVSRVFHPDETSEVRIDLGGGDDSLVATGHSGKITVRVIGGDGDDTIDDTAGTGLRVSDASGTNRVRRGSGTKLDTRPYTAPERKKAAWIPPRDWGRRNIFIPWIGGNSDLGVLFLASLQSFGYGFRKDPYASKQTIRVGYATRAGSFGVDYRGEFRRENTRVATGLYARASGLDFLHFYGFGNETDASEDEDFYKLKHTQYTLEPSLLLPVGSSWTAKLQVNAQYKKTELEPGRYITTAPPYGAEDFFQFGAGAGLSVDTRDSDVASTRGVRFAVDGNVFPPIGAVETTFGEVHSEAALYQPISVLTTPILALRAGGQRVWGTYPYDEAAYVGGGATLRGFPQQRFAGDGSLYGSAELRIPIARVYVFVPGSLGVFALGDTGRVYLTGESSNQWHSAAGGGLWFALLDAANTVSVSIASSEEGTGVYIHAGLAF